MLQLSTVHPNRTPQRVLALMLAMLITLPSVAKDQVPWVEELSQAQATATAKKQLILLHFWDTSCPPCKRVEKNVFSQATFAHQLAEKYVPVKVKVSQNPELSRRYHIEAWPTDVIITATGEEVYRTISPQDPNNYLSMLNQVAWRYETRPPGAAAQFATTSGLPGMHNSAGKPPTSDFIASQAMLMSHSQTDNQGLQGPSAATGYSPAATGLASAQAPLSPETSGATPETTFPESAAAATTDNSYASSYEANDTTASMPEPNPRMVDNPFVMPPTPATPATAAPATGTPTGPSPITSFANPQLPATAVTPATAAAQVAAPGGQPRNASHDYTMSLTAPSGSSVSPSEPTPARRPSEPTSGTARADLAARDAGAAHRRPGYQTPSAAADYTAVAQSRPLKKPTRSAATEPPKTTTLGLDGYCPVALVDHGRWVAGDKQWGAHHRGRTYLFQSSEAQQKFLASPDRYSPGLAGFDPVVFTEQGEYQEGKRVHGIMYHNQIFLFADEGSLSRFWSAPDRYAGLIHQAMGTRESQFR